MNYLQIPGIKGESTQAQHQGWIELTTLSFGVSVPTEAAGAGKPQFDDVVFQKALDSTSFTIYSYILTGKPIDGAAIEITSTTAAGVESVRYRVELTAAKFSAVTTQIGGTAGTVEELRVSCSQMKWSNVTADSTGKVSTTYETGWNQTTNTAI